MNIRNCLDASRVRTPKKRLQAEGITPLAARVLSARGVNNSDDIVPALRRLPPPSDLPGAESAACELAAAITASQKICVVGDYDVDGMTATAIAVDCLTFLGADVIGLFHVVVPAMVYHRRWLKKRRGVALIGF